MTLLSSAGGSGWWLGGAFIVVCMVMMALMMSHGSHGSSWLPRVGGRHDHEPRRPQETLADRLARSEIDVEEYERRLAALNQTSDAAKSG